MPLRCKQERVKKDKVRGTEQPGENPKVSYGGGRDQLEGCSGHRVTEALLYKGYPRISCCRQLSLHSGVPRGRDVVGKGFEMLSFLRSNRLFLENLGLWGKERVKFTESGAAFTHTTQKLKNSPEPQRDVELPMASEFVLLCSHCISPSFPSILS